MAMLLRRGFLTTMLLVLSLQGCGSSDTPPPPEEVKAQEAAHADIAAREAEKYKKGPRAAHKQ